MESYLKITSINGSGWQVSSIQAHNCGFSCFAECARTDSSKHDHQIASTTCSAGCISFCSRVLTNAKVTWSAHKIGKPRCGDSFADRQWVRIVNRPLLWWSSRLSLQFDKGSGNQGSFLVVARACGLVCCTLSYNFLFYKTKVVEWFPYTVSTLSHLIWRFLSTLLLFFDVCTTRAIVNRYFFSKILHGPFTLAINVHTYVKTAWNN